MCRNMLQVRSAPVFELIASISGCQIRLHALFRQPHGNFASMRKQEYSKESNSPPSFAGQTRGQGSPELGLMALLSQRPRSGWKSLDPDRSSKKATSTFPPELFQASQIGVLAGMRIPVGCSSLPDSEQHKFFNYRIDPVLNEERTNKRRQAPDRERRTS